MRPSANKLAWTVRMLLVGLAACSGRGPVSDDVAIDGAVGGTADAADARSDGLDAGVLDTQDPDSELDAPEPFDAGADEGVMDAGNDPDDGDLPEWEDGWLDPSLCADESWVPYLTNVESDLVDFFVAHADPPVACVDGVRVTVTDSSGWEPENLLLWLSTGSKWGYTARSPNVQPFTRPYINSNDAIVLLEIAAYEPDDPANDEAFPLIYAIGTNTGRDGIIDPIRFERTEHGWLVETRLPASVVMVTEAPCGNGVLDPGEECDGDETEDGQSACNSRCEVRPGFACDDDRCYHVCDELACEDDRDWCMASACHEEAGACYRMPIRDGEACVRDEGGLGACDNGRCVEPHQTCDECVASGPTGWGRWIDGACHPTEFYDLYDAPGAQIYLGDCDRCEGPLTGGVCSAIMDFGPSYEGYAVQLVYRPAEYTTTSSGEIEPVATHQVYPFERTGGDVGWVDLPVSDDGSWSEIHLAAAVTSEEVDPDFEIRLASDSAYANVCQSRALAVGLLKYSERGVDLCDIAVDVDGRWEQCPERIGYQRCRVDACTDVLTDSQNCGACGVVCGELERCVGGACVCHPVLTEHAPDSCDGCQPGFAGLHCDVACPGALGSDVYCGGNGTCDDGPFGSGRCDCDPGYHGPACEFRCDDGVRNGLENAIDCGAGCPGEHCVWPY